MSVLFAKFLNVAARTAQAGASGYAQRPETAPKGRRRKGRKQAGCTPCEAMARREAAQKLVSGG
jgi:hypothetical protein